MKKYFLLPLLLCISLLLIECKKKDKTEDPPPPPPPPKNLPTVNTSPVINITDSTAVSGGTVTSEGTSAITAVGVCWDTLPNPTTLKFKTNNGAGTGNFVSNLTGLKVNKTYYVRAYATNGSGTEYGNQISFQTPVVYTWIKSNSASSLSITCLISNGASIYAGTTNGVVFSSDTGNTWVQKGLAGNQITNIYQKNNILYAISAYTLYRSLDNGSTWNTLSVNFPYAVRVYDVLDHNGKLYAGTDSSAFVSTNGGTSWTRIKNGLPSPTPGWGGGFVLRMVNVGTQLYGIAGQFVGPSYDIRNYKYDELGNTWNYLASFGTSITVGSFKTSGTRLFISNYSLGSTAVSSSPDGSSWSTVCLAQGFSYRSFDTYNAFVFINKLDGTLLFSDDSGVSYGTVSQLGLTPGNFYEAYITPYHLWLRTSNGMYRIKYN